jgi:hypothetical protein
MQVYNEAVFDLLRGEPAPLGGRPALRLREDAQGRVFVDGAQEARGLCYEFTLLMTGSGCTDGAQGQM